MGSVLSILSHNLFYYLPFNLWSNSNKYKKVDEKQNHSACRSLNKNKLTAYQSKVDNLKQDEIVYRTYVPDDKVSWSVDWPEYKPSEYTILKILKDKPDWADENDPTKYKYNQLDGKIDRRSHLGKYEVVDGRPRNPIGRTGITGRGQLGKWGVNHAADPIVTRWKKDENGNRVKNPQTNKYILQFVSINRLDTHQWAIPGGMCDPGEKVSQTLKREFMEEATDCLGSNEAQRKQIEEHLKEFFENGNEIYKGYVDDPRNTDNAWMETIAYNFHDEDDSVFKEFKLTAGDDAGSVTWMDIDKNLNLYASHKDFIQLTAEKHNAHW